MRRTRIAGSAAHLESLPATEATPDVEPPREPDLDIRLHFLGRMKATADCGRTIELVRPAYHSASLNPRYFPAGSRWGRASHPLIEFERYDMDWERQVQQAHRSRYGRP